MRKFLYVVCALSYIQTILPGMFDNIALSISMPSRTALSTTRILDLHEEITDTKALACYKLYASELKGKSQEELNRLLTQCFNYPDPKRPLYRQKVIALLLCGAQSESIIYNNPLHNAIVHDDIPLARCTCVHHSENPNRLLHGDPLWFHCQSPEMAQLLIRYGADLDAKDSRNHNVIHHLCFSGIMNAALVEFYCRIRPSLLDEKDALGNTPLSLALRHLIAPNPSVYLLINLGAKTGALTITDEHEMRNHAALARRKAREERNKELAKEFLALAEHIEHQSKFTAHFLN